VGTRSHKPTVAPPLLEDLPEVEDWVPVVEVEVEADLDPVVEVDADLDPVVAEADDEEEADLDPVEAEADDEEEADLVPVVAP